MSRVLEWVLAGEAPRPPESKWGIALTVLSIVATAALGIYVAWQSRKATESVAKTNKATKEFELEADAYKRAREMDESILSNIKDELKRCREEMASLRLEIELRDATIERREATIEERDRTIRSLRKKLTALEESIDRLSNYLRQVGIDVPPNIHFTEELSSE